ncbi:MAG: cyclic lactone autoinducer peptide [Oscillospiraceae bacterium]|nr:cyclic lactone autoinducer peptide [Oscillospiraceae bacterium]
MNYNNSKKTVLRAISRTAMRFTEKSVNSSCFLWRFQPKESEKIKKLRRF